MAAVELLETPEFTTEPVLASGASGAKSRRTFRQGATLLQRRRARELLAPSSALRSRRGSFSVPHWPCSRCPVTSLARRRERDFERSRRAPRCSRRA